MNQFSLLAKADVKVTHIYDDHKRNVAEITVNDTFTHRFSPTSRISKHLEVMKPADLQDRLSGGTYFFIGDELVDLRDNQYNGFVHTPDTINAFIDILGFHRASDIAKPRRARAVKRQAENDVSGNILLRKIWSKNEISVPNYADGGDFETELSFLWNPFVKTINSSFDLVRLICENGMIGLTPFLNTKIPLMNRWEEHLDIASRQIQNKVNDVVISRVQSMTNERSSVGDCLLIEQHAFDRLASPEVRSNEERERLKTLITTVSPKHHLHNVYQDAVFADRNVASQLPAHLTNFDMYNIATELRSHTVPCAKSSSFALDKFANAIMFDRQDNFIAMGSRYSSPAKSAFSSPETAFFGTLQ